MRPYIRENSIVINTGSFFMHGYTIETTFHKRANPDKTNVTVIYLRNREAQRLLQVSWNRVNLENTAHPKYLGVTLDVEIQTSHGYAYHQDEGTYTKQLFEEFT